MNCVEAKNLIQLYMDNELSARESLDVQHHIEGCASCMALLNYFIKQDEALREGAREVLGSNEQLRDKIITAVQNEPLLVPAPPARVWWQRPAWRRIAAGVIVVIGAALFFLRGSTPFNDKVYADAVADHDHHCTREVLDKFEEKKVVFSNREKVDSLTASFSTLKQVPDISAFGYVEPRAVICSLNGMKALHIIYQNPTQKPLSIFLRLRDAEMVRNDLVDLKRDGHHLASLSQSGTDLVVVAALDEEQTSSIAKAIAKQFGH